MTRKSTAPIPTIDNRRATNTMIVNILSSLFSPIDWLGPFVVDWYWKFQLISLLLLTGTILFGLLTIIAGRESNKRQTIQILQLDKEASDARRATAQLWKDIAPREIADQSGMIETLKPYAGVKFVLISLSDIEVVRTAEQIYSSLELANWLEARPPEKTMDDSRFMHDVLIQSTPIDRMTTNAADILARQLERNNIRTLRVPYNENDERIYGFRGQFVVLIKVGFKSFPQPPDRPEPEAPEGGVRMRGNRLGFPPPQNR